MFDIENNAAALFLNSLTEDAAYNGVTEATACLTHLPILIWCYRLRIDMSDCPATD